MTWSRREGEVQSGGRPVPEPAHLTAGGQLPTSAHLPRAGGQCPPGKGKWAIAHLEKVSGQCPPGKGKWAVPTWKR